MYIFLRNLFLSSVWIGFLPASINAFHFWFVSIHDLDAQLLSSHDEVWKLPFSEMVQNEEGLQVVQFKLNIPYY